MTHSLHIQALAARFERRLGKKLEAMNEKHTPEDVPRPGDGKVRCPKHGAPHVPVTLPAWQEGPPDPNGYECGCDYSPRSGVASAPMYTGAIIHGENGPIKVVADVMQPTLDKPAIGYVEDGPAAAGVRRERAWPGPPCEKCSSESVALSHGSEACPHDEPRWRVGTKLGRTLYKDGACVGMVDTPELAAEIVRAMLSSGDLKETK